MDYSPDQMKDFIDSSIHRYFIYKSLDALGTKAMNKVFGDKGEDLMDLDAQQKKLDILYRKRQLGLPMDDGDYEDAVNNNKPFMSRTTTLAGKTALQAIPGPLGEAKKPVFKIASLVEDALPSMVNKSVSQGGVSRYAAGFKRIASFL